MISSNNVCQLKLAEIDDLYIKYALCMFTLIVICCQQPMKQWQNFHLTSLNCHKNVTSNNIWQ